MSTSDQKPGPDAPGRYADDPDTALAQRCLAHDRAAWSAFVERFSRLIFSVVYDSLRRHGVAAEPDTVDELFHTVFAALYDNDYKKLRQWSRRCSLASWVRLVAASTVVDKLRKRRPMVSLEATSEAEAPGPLPSALVDDASAPLLLLERAAQIKAVRAALQELPDNDRELLQELFVLETPAAELAARLGIRPGALYTRKNRALNRLKAVLGPIVDTL